MNPWDIYFIQFFILLILRVALIIFTVFAIKSKKKQNKIKRAMCLLFLNIALLIGFTVFMVSHNFI